MLQKQYHRAPVYATILVPDVEVKARKAKRLGKQNGRTAAIPENLTIEDPLKQLKMRRGGDFPPESDAVFEGEQPSYQQRVNALAEKAMAQADNPRPVGYGLKKASNKKVKMTPELAAIRKEWTYTDLSDNGPKGPALAFTKPRKSRAKKV
jgi:hypothetical protein